MGVGIDVVQPHPSAQLAQFSRQISDVATHLAILPPVHIVFTIKAIGAGVLRDHEQFLDPSLNQFFSLAQHRMGRTAGEFAAHVGDDAELALVIAAF
jgi:hypothetical protein